MVRISEVDSLEFPVFGFTGMLSLEKVGFYPLFRTRI